MAEAAAAGGEASASSASELGLGCVGLDHGQAVGGAALAWGVAETSVDGVVGVQRPRTYPGCPQKKSDAERAPKKCNSRPE